MIDVQVKGGAELAARFKALSQKIPDLIVRTLTLASLLMREKLVKRMTRTAGYDPFWGKQSPAGEYLGARTGLTVKRLSPGLKVTQSGKTYRTAVGSPDAHVAFFEHGGTIQGRQFLRIPTAAAQSASGAEQGRFAGRSLRDVPGVFLFKSKAGRLWAAEKRDKKLTLLFLLQRAAKFRPRGIFAAVAAEMHDELDKIGATELRATVQRAGLA